MDLHLIGAKGKLGLAIQQLLPHDSLNLKGAYIRPSSPFINTQSLVSSIRYSILPQKFKGVCIDVSSPEALIYNLPLYKKNKAPVVIGSTGHQPQLLEQLKKESVHFPILYATNFSKGVFLLSQALQTLSSYSEHMPHRFLKETHHIHKKDTPSGTALTLNAILPSTQPIISMRKEETTGIHEYRISLPQEELTLSHTAHNREVFAQGALQSALFLSMQSPGWYTIADVFKEKS